MKNTWLCVALALLATVLVMGCAADRVVGVAPDSSAATARASDCPFNLERVEDRRDRADLGQIGRTVVEGEGFVDWLRGGVAAIPGHARDVAPRALRLTVLKAYVQGVGTMKAANIVVRAELLQDGRRWKEMHLRGVDNSANWNTGESEVQEAMRRARTDLNAQLAAEISAMCRRPTH